MSLDFALCAASNSIFRSNFFGRTRTPFAIQLLGKKLFICTDPADVSTVFNDTVGFNFDNHLTSLLVSFGISKEGLKRAWHQPEPGDWCYIPDNPINPQQKSLIHCVEDVYKQQLLPGDHMNDWCRVWLGSVLTQMSGLSSLEFCTTMVPICPWCEDCAPRQVSLYSLVSFFSVQATAQAMFGPHLLEICPDVVHHMLSFNKHVWMIVFQYPNVMGLPVDTPRRHLMVAMKRFLQLPDNKLSQASWSMRSVIHGMETVGMDVESQASMILMIFWA